MKLLAAVLVMSSSTIALAEEPAPPPADPAGAPAVPEEPPPPQPPPPQPTPPPAIQPPSMQPVVERGGPPRRGFVLQGRMSTTFGIGNFVFPGFAIGYRRGNWVFGGQLGVIAGKIEDDGGTTDSFSLVTIMPMIYYGIWSSEDGRARMDVLGGVGVGKGTLRSESGGTTSEETASIVPLMLGVGGDYYLHKNFALGVEVGVELPVLGKVEQDGMDVGVKGATQAIHGMFRVTFVAGD